MNIPNLKGRFLKNQVQVPWRQRRLHWQSYIPNQGVPDQRQKKENRKGREQAPNGTQGQFMIDAPLKKGQNPGHSDGTLVHIHSLALHNKSSKYDCNYSKRWIYTPSTWWESQIMTPPYLKTWLLKAKASKPVTVKQGGRPVLGTEGTEAAAKERP